MTIGCFKCFTGFSIAFKSNFRLISMTLWKSWALCTCPTHVWLVPTVTLCCRHSKVWHLQFLEIILLLMKLLSTGFSQHSWLLSFCVPRLSLIILLKSYLSDLLLNFILNWGLKSFCELLHHKSMIIVFPFSLIVVLIKSWSDVSSHEPGTGKTLKHT